MKECAQNGRIHENCKDQCLFRIHSAIIFRIYVRDRQQRTSVSLLTDFVCKVPPPPAPPTPIPTLNIQYQVGQNTKQS